MRGIVSLNFPLPLPTCGTLVLLVNLSTINVMPSFIHPPLMIASWIALDITPLHERAQPVAQPEPAAAHALRLRDEHLVDEAVLDGLVRRKIKIPGPVWKSNSRRVRSPRHRRDARSTAWRCGSGLTG